MVCPLLLLLADGKLIIKGCEGVAMDDDDADDGADACCRRCSLKKPLLLLDKDVDTTLVGCLPRNSSCKTCSFMSCCFKLVRLMMDWT